MRHIQSVSREGGRQEGKERKPEGKEEREGERGKWVVGGEERRKRGEGEGKGRRRKKEKKPVTFPFLPRLSTVISL